MQLIDDESAEPGAEAVGRDSWYRRFDPLVVAVAAVSLVTYVLHGFHGLLTRDLGVYAYGARQVLAGEPPYVGIVNRAGPLAHMLPVPGIVAARIVGGNELVGMRAWYMVIAVASVVVTYIVARDLFASRTAGLAAAATMLSFQGFIDLATDGPREKTPMVLFILCAIWAVSHRRWLLTGVSISLATLTLQVAFLPLLVGALVGILLVGPGRRLKDLVRLAIGGAIPVAVLLAYFAAYGALQDLLDGFLLLNLRYTHGRGVTARILAVAVAMKEGYGVTLWLMLAGLVLIIAIAVVRWLDPATRHDPATVTLVVVAVITVGSLLWMEVDFDSWEDAFTVLPLAALGIGAGTTWLLQHLPQRAAPVVGVLAVALPTVLAVQYSAATRDDQLVQQQALLKEILAEDPGARIWSIEAPQYLVLDRQKAVTRYQLFAQGLRRNIDHTWPGGIKAFVAWNLAQQPDLIALNSDEMKIGHWRHRVEADYIQVGHGPGAYFFARRSLGPDVITAMRRANARIFTRFGCPCPAG
ncbi:MAG: hypothetical protein WAV00_13050 [Nocardioides sp.]